MPKTHEIEGLNEGAVIQYVRGAQENLPRYQIARNNCSHVVASALMAGAGRKASFIPHSGSHGRLGCVVGMGVRTPAMVLKFVQELGGHLTQTSRADDHVP